MEGERIFVYGTLMSADGLGAMLNGCEHEGEAEVGGRMYDLGEYPAVVLGGGGRVHGEIWRCAAEVLPELDAYEGVAEGLFARTRTTIEGAPCWIYVAGPLLEPHLTADKVLTSGRWRGR